MKLQESEVEVAVLSRLLDKVDKVDLADKVASVPEVRYLHTRCGAMVSSGTCCDAPLSFSECRAVYVKYGALGIRERCQWRGRSQGRHTVSQRGVCDRACVLVPVPAQSRPPLVRGCVFAASRAGALVTTCSGYGEGVRVAAVWCIALPLPLCCV